MTLGDDRHKAFFMSVCLACVYELKAGESGNTNRSMRRRKALNRLEAELTKITRRDYLEGDGFAFEDMERAKELVDFLNEKIREMYSEPATQCVVNGA